MKNQNIIFSFILLLALVGPGMGQTTDSSDSQEQPAAAADAHELAKKLSNPVSSLISFPFQSNFDFGMGTGSGWRYQLNIQPVVPFRLNSNWNLISRTILPVVHQSKVANSGSQSGLGDITQSFFFSPQSKNGFTWAIGPALLIPTATDELLGTEKFGLGPTALVLKQKEGWTYGMLSNHIWSVAGDDDRASVTLRFSNRFSLTTRKTPGLTPSTRNRVTTGPAITGACRSTSRCRSS
ncbi:MAG TPA: hypothetical protein VFS76_12295 [Pyrinomonadaceae bacterium]|nr:hypothetical protein [Pyrinomonadaceae bacterium]